MTRLDAMTDLLRIARHVAKQGMASTVADLKKGRLPLSLTWTAMNGARRYLIAIATGDIADDHTVETRCEECSYCSCALPANHSVGDATAVHCGEAFVETDTTCGCLVGWTIEGKRLHAAGKLLVESEQCPQSKW